MTAMTITEELTYFACQGVDLAGILTVPAEPNGVTVVLPWGSGAYPSSGRNRVRTSLARALAANGFHALRFDKPGIGESDGEYELPDLSFPQTAEILAAAEWLEHRGLSRIAIVGNCFGAWSSLMAAPEVTNLEAIVAIGSPVGRDHGQVRAKEERWRWWLRKLRSLRLRRLLRAKVRARYRRQLSAHASMLAKPQRSNARFVQAIRHLLGRKVPVLLIYGEENTFRADAENELRTWLQVAFEEAGPPSGIVTMNARLEGYGNMEGQDALMEIVVPWLQGSFRSNQR